MRKGAAMHSINKELVIGGGIGGMCALELQGPTFAWV